MVTLSSEPEGISTRYAVNELPTARLTLDNKFGRYTSASGDVSEGQPVILSSSVDGGNTYYRVFSGSVVKKTSELSANGVEIVQLLCRDDRFARQYISFNNSVQRSKDIGQVFTGSNTASDLTTWS